MIQADIGQLETEISQQIVKLYNKRIGKSPSQIICHFLDAEIVISLENSVTQAEYTLLKEGYATLAEQVRLYLETIIKPELKSLIEVIIGQPVLELMTNTNLATGRTGIVVVFNQLPDVPNPESIIKINLNNLAD
ncbi:hypothetical protein CDG77_12815 [Nostoc sp. 'Peltigera membranacea cyanobiont' 213]|uniref:DUF2294 domain-containing protein n=2 Tax=Nostoc TaxID=1177 RepID=UPI000B95973C|nr:DUF2294 domain-containing protein [Nostoc sp. 'Peltigera membranacea cyanobiont' N6]AVH66861.1 protein of unknown function YbcI/DUF2294 [Nostoc sp. 'Peltigera membranacea cyanobiont' N6]OYD94145.1 hypothetical protein CDG77_12815 [Nostoc sp. 'Peltigera membranacea cyanobiont' 213]